ncbi:hypothetical protein I553_3514 [Mycobacterium xenopi 4042]|uniref:Uncharacterized protein n=1 Tax=Mycobacterium xenopi 4042 TaxID=1299334 RepID=X7ZYB1_MYCXE|nr:hypothetical protein I553_3514 [Mycobacterium xenopi 4042]
MCWQLASMVAAIGYWCAHRVIEESCQVRRTRFHVANVNRLGAVPRRCSLWGRGDSRLRASPRVAM